MRSRAAIIVLIAALLLGAILRIVFLHGAIHSDSLLDTAKQIVASCEKNPGDHAACYQAEVPNLYPKYSVAQIFGVLRDIRTLDTSYRYCHVLGHSIGERVVAEDPDRWVEDLGLTPPDGICSNGYIHGIISGRFRSEVLTDDTIQTFLPDFSRACQPSSIWSPSGFDEEECFHSMGHLLDFITDANIPKSLTLCEKAIPAGYQKNCMEGVFMQIFHPREPDDTLLIAKLPVRPDIETYRAYCASFGSAVYVGACLRETWSMYAESLREPGGITSFCSNQPDDHEAQNCYQVAFSAIAWTNLSDPTAVARACGYAPQDMRESCLITAAKRMMGEDKLDGKSVIALCSAASADLKDDCFSGAAALSSYLFGEDADEYNTYCPLFMGANRDRCFAQKPQKAA